jgi:putative DNA primase/helicase
MSDDSAQRIAALVEEAVSVASPGDDHAPPPAPDVDVDHGEDGPSPDGDPTIDLDVVANCAALDTSDTDNAERFLRHFGGDFAVIAATGTAGGDRVVWAGTHWDVPNGAALAQTLASRLGARIGLEVQFFQHLPHEAEAIEAAKGLPDDLDDPAIGEDKAVKRLVRRKAKAREALMKRIARRLNHAVTSKNSGRVESMFAFADPRARRPHSDFNADRMKIATPGHTLQFRREPDPECPDPDATRYRGIIEAADGHNRADMLTACIPTAWKGLDCPAPRWRDFLARMVPSAEKRRTLQMFTGLSLTGVPTQYLMFHYGSGANGKSVYLETIYRVLGESIGVGLPRESIVGNGDRGAGSASPDIIRLLFKRFVRILEVKGDVPLQDDLVKRLTGGEAIQARALFKGYIDFQNQAKGHMSGNKKPSLDGSDYGIVRRLLLMHWDQIIPEEERGEFEDVVAGFVENEGPGILAWLAEGVIDWINNGEKLFIAQEVRDATQAYADQNDPVGEFIRACMRDAPGVRVGGLEAYEAFQSWRMANARPERSLRKVGDILTEKFKKAEIAGRVFYMNVELHDVPERPEASPNPRKDDGYRR